MKFLKAKSLIKICLRAMLFYENTFSIDETELILEQNINLEKSEQCFGLFL